MEHGGSSSSPTAERRIGLLADKVPAKARAGRRNDIDAIRILTCFSVIFGHALAAFSASLVYHVRADSPSDVATLIYEARHVWSMPTFFFIAGWAAMVALRSNGWRPFWTNRIRRLGVPLVVALIVLMPVIKFYELKGGISMQPNRIAEVAPLTMGFLEFIPEYFSHSKLVTWSHVWFLIYLGGITIIAFPLLAWLAGRRNEGRPLPLWLLVLPPAALAAWLVVSGGWWPYYPNVYKDLPNVVYFTGFFGLGVLMAWHEGFEAAIVRARLWLAAVGLAALVGMEFTLHNDAGRVFTAIAAWGIVAALYGYMKQIPFKAGPVFRYLKQAILPLFIVHHVFNVIIAWYVLQLDWPWPLAFLIILSGTLAATFAVYHFLIRPFAVTRFLFGAPRG